MVIVGGGFSLDVLIAEDFHPSKGFAGWRSLNVGLVRWNTSEQDCSGKPQCTPNSMVRLLLLRLLINVRKRCIGATANRDAGAAHGIRESECCLYCTFYILSTSNRRLEYWSLHIAYLSLFLVAYALGAFKMYGSGNLHSSHEFYLKIYLAPLAIPLIKVPYKAQATKY